MYTYVDSDIANLPKVLDDSFNDVLKCVFEVATQLGIHFYALCCK